MCCPLPVATGRTAEPVLLPARAGQSARDIPFRPGPICVLINRRILVPALALQYVLCRTVSVFLQPQTGSQPPSLGQHSSCRLFSHPSLFRIRICSNHTPAPHPAELVLRSILTRKCHNSVVLTTRESAIVPIKDRRRAASPIVGNTPKLALGL